MLSVMEAIKIRRSVRKFAPDDVSQEVIDQMLEAARLAPSGSNRQPWRFLVVRDPETRQKLREICLQQRFIEEAPVVIICFGDLDRFSPEASKKRRQEFEESGVLETLSGFFADPRYREYMESLDNQPSPPREQLVIPLISNTYIAIEHMVLVAAALGLGTCWVGAFDRSALNRLFGLEDNLVPVAVLPVGYPAGKLPPPRPRLSLEEIVIRPQVKHTGEEA